QYPGLKAGASFQDGSQAGALRRKGSERRPSYAARRLLPGLKPGASAGGTLGNLRAAQIPVNAAELYEGAWRSSRALAQVGELDRMLQGVVILEMTLVAAREFGRLKTDLQRQGTSVGDWDLLIASIALACGESRVVTRNAKDFERIPGIEVVSC
ncbi:MAG: type II toxin-antitoxin system VapC family toxin, partial [Halobacteria archaeon]